MFCFQVNSVIATVFVGLVVILILTEKSRGSRKGSRRGSRRESRRGSRKGDPRFVYTRLRFVDKIGPK